MTRCKSCGGTYVPVGADGLTYYHACPPVWDDSNKRYVERADKRDENVRVTGHDKDGRPIVEPKSPGKGVEVL